MRELTLFFILISFTGCGGGGEKEESLPVVPVLNSLTAVPGDRKVTLTWTSAPAATSDHAVWVEIMPDGALIDQIQGEEAGVISPHDVGGLVNGRAYQFKIDSYRNGGLIGSTDWVDASPHP
jgi:hypothetical protein